jgi:hypothetical protein
LLGLYCDTPPVFPPDEIDTNENQIVPNCAADKAAWADQDTINAAIDALCINGNQFGCASQKYSKSGIPETYVHAAAKGIDAQATYKQGSTVCWQASALYHKFDVLLTGLPLQSPYSLERSNYRI